MPALYPAQASIAEELSLGKRESLSPYLEEQVQSQWGYSDLNKHKLGSTCECSSHDESGSLIFNLVMAGTFTLFQLQGALRAICMAPQESHTS